MFRFIWGVVVTVAVILLIFISIAYLSGNLHCDTIDGVVRDYAVCMIGLPK